MKTINQTFKKEILILGVVHASQDKRDFEKRLKLLKARGFKKNFIEKEKSSILAVRKEMLKEIKNFNPQIIFEECGPWLKKPADRWKKIIGSKKTILEEKYFKKHFFVDIQLAKSFKKFSYPSHQEREKVIYNQILEKFKKFKKIKRAILIIGTHHFENIIKFFKKTDFQIKAINLKKKFFKFLKKYKIYF